MRQTHVVLGMRRGCARRGLHPERTGQVLEVVQRGVLQLSQNHDLHLLAGMVLHDDRLFHSNADCFILQLRLRHEGSHDCRVQRLQKHCAAEELVLQGLESCHLFASDGAVISKEFEAAAKSSSALAA